MDLPLAPAYHGGVGDGDQLFSMPKPFQLKKKKYGKNFTPIIKKMYMVKRTKVCLASIVQPSPELIK